ncbi:MAG: hypothetical protein ACLRXQ_05115 [Phascolarctobacterium faecium]
MAGKPADSVLEQAPKAKNKTPKGSKVDLVVCRDPKDLSMPDVMGSSLNDAKSPDRVRYHGYYRTLC